MPMSTNRRLPEAATGIPAWQHKQAAYVPAYAAPVSAAEQQDRLALLAAGMEPPDVLAAIGTALQVETLPLQVQSVVLALDGDESGQKANQKLDSEVQAAGLAATLCPVPADGLGKDWSERWRRASDLDDVYLTFEAWSSAGNHVRLTV